MAMTDSERALKSKHNRIAKGLCPTCGEPNDQGFYYCQNCREKNKRYRRATYRFYKSIGFCTVCHKNRIYGDEATCPECRAELNIKYSHSKAAYQANHRKKLNDNARRRYAERKAEGICVHCGKRAAVPNRTRCQLCLNSEAEKRRLARWEKKNEEDGE